MKRNKCLGSLLVLSSLAASASALADGPDYNFVQAGFMAGDYADIEPFDLKGLEIEGSAELGYNFFVTGRYRDSDDKWSGVTFNEDNWQVGGGYIYRFSDQTAFDFQVSYGEINIELFNDEERQKAGANFSSLAANVRHNITDSIELYAGLEWQFWNAGTDQKAYNLGAQYFFGESKAFSVGAEYTKFSDSQWCKIFARYTF